MAMSDEERKKRIAELKKQIANNKKREGKDTRSLKSLIGTTPKKAVVKKKKAVKKKRTAEDMVDELKKNRGRIPKKNK